MPLPYTTTIVPFSSIDWSTPSISRERGRAQHVGRVAILIQLRELARKQVVQLGNLGATWG